MNKSEFNHGLPAQPDDIEEKLSVSSSGRFQFFKVRMFGVNNFVKLPSPEYYGDYLTLESLRKEYSIGFNLNHPNVVRYLKFDGYSLFEEFVEGKTLREMIDNSDPKLSDNKLLKKICRQGLNALDYIHSYGIVHNDLKPENIILTRIGDNVKIVDFGCAYSGLSDTSGGSTPKYRSPEYTSSTPDCREDIYQWGRVMQELAQAGKQTKRWNRFVAKSIHKIPDKRFKNAAEAANSLNKRKHQKVLILTTIILALIGFVWFLFIGNPQQKTVAGHKANTPEIAEDSLTSVSVSDKPVVDQSEKSLKGVNLESETVKSVNLEEVIDREINNFANSYYADNILPIVENPLQYGFEPLSGEQTEAMRNEFTKAKEVMKTLQDELIAQYPSKKEYIELQIVKAIDSNQSFIGVKYSNQSK